MAFGLRQKETGNGPFKNSRYGLDGKGLLAVPDGEPLAVDRADGDAKFFRVLFRKLGKKIGQSALFVTFALKKIGSTLNLRSQSEPLSQCSI